VVFNNIIVDWTAFWTAFRARLHVYNCHFNLPSWLRNRRRA
jgi:hypothetical protein